MTEKPARTMREYNAERRTRQCSPACSEQHTYQPPCELAPPEAQPEPTDPTQCTGDEGFCPEHGFHRHSLKQPRPDQPDTEFGSPDCTCIPFTRRDGKPRYCGPADTVDNISGWETGRDCPHHGRGPAPAAHAGPCGQHCTHEAPAPATSLREHWCGHSHDHVAHAHTGGGESMWCLGSHAQIYGDTPPAPQLRDQYAAAMREHYLASSRDEADADGNMPCRCGDWREPGAEVDDENDWDSHLADAVLAVPAIQQAQAEVDLAKRISRSAARDASTALTHQLVAEAAVDRVRAIHRPVQYRGRPICVECSGYDGSTCDNGPQPHPCPTIAALDPQEQP